MEKVKLKLTRGTVISTGTHGIKNEIIEVDLQTALNLRQAGAAVIAEENTKVGKLVSKK